MLSWRTKSINQIFPIQLALPQQFFCKNSRYSVRGDSSVLNLIARFARDESGATAIEYGLIASLIAIAITAAATTLGTDLGGTFNNVANNLQ
jgi:pilus assembly protein Flp/PilA